MNECTYKNYDEVRLRGLSHCESRQVSASCEASHGGSQRTV